MSTGETVSDVTIVLTNRVTTVTGTVVDDKGVGRSDATMVLFGVDESQWAAPAASRWVRASRGDQQGQFRVRGLPPGDYYAVAIEYVEDGQWNDPEYLRSLLRYARRITVSDAEERVIALKMIDMR